MNKRKMQLAFFQQAPGMFCIIDFEGNFQMVNDEMLVFLRHPREEIIGEPFFPFVHEEDMPATERAYRVLLSGDNVYEFENRYLCGDDQYRWLSWRVRPNVEERHFYCVTREVTFEKEIEPTLPRNPSGYLPALEGISDAFFAVDKKWRFTYLNREAEKLLLRKSERLLGRRVWDEFPEALDSVFGRNYQQAMTNRQTVAFTAYYEPLSTWFRVMAYPTEKGLSVYFHDATEQVETEQALRYTKERLEEEIAARTAALAEMVEQLRKEARERAAAERELFRNEARLSNILNTAAESIIVVDEAQIITMFNQGAVNTFGYTEEEAVGMPLDRLIPAERQSVHREHIVMFGQQSQQARRMAAHRSEVQGVCKDGSRFFAEASIAKIEMEGELSYIAVLRDVTERRYLEQRLRDSLQRTQELSDLKSNFITNVSHQFRTPLATISASADVIDLLNEGNKFDRPLRRIAANVNRLNMLLDAGLDLVNLSGHDHPTVDLQSTDVIQLCRRTSADVQESLRVNGRIDPQIRLEVEGDIPPVWLDRSLMQRLLSNLLRNAVEYSDTVVRLHLTVEDERLMLRIRDNGLGIPADDLPHVHEMFYRGRNVSHVPGLGLGLSFVDAAVKLQGGQMKIESVEGEGTSVTVILPIVWELGAEGSQ